MRNVLLMLIATMMLASACSDQKSPLYGEKIAKDNLESLVQKIKDDKSFSSDEIVLFANGISRLTLLDSTILDKTIGDVIQSQKDFAKNQNSMSLALNLARYDMILKHKFTYINIIPKDTNGKKYDFVVFAIKNTSGKDLKNIEGSLQFYTQNNEVVKQYNIAAGSVMNGRIIKNGDSLRIAYPFYHVDGNIRDSMMRANPGMRAIWTPSKMEFTDGKQIAVPLVR